MTQRVRVHGRPEEARTLGPTTSWRHFKFAELQYRFARFACRLTETPPCAKLATTPGYGASRHHQ